jgi:hypothetical protein
MSLSPRLRIPGGVALCAVGVLCVACGGRGSSGAAADAGFFADALDHVLTESW